MSSAAQAVAKAVQTLNKKKRAVGDGGPFEWEYHDGSFLAVSGPRRPRVEEATAGIYTGIHTQKGIFLVPMTIITDNLLDLPNPHVARVVNSVKKFWTRREKYFEYGQLYKRGILMYGGPGSGKTVTLTLLSRELVEAGGMVLYFNDPGTAVTVLTTIRQRELERPLIVVFEDLDEQISNYGEHGFLGLLDGEYKVDNIVFLATTNYLEKLPLRLRARPSRFDEVVEIPMPSHDVREAYLRHLLSTEASIDETELAKWANESDGFSLAHLKELVISVKVLDNDYSESLKRLKELGTILNAEQEEES